MGRGGDVGPFGGKLTVAVTPLSLFSLAWTRAAQAAQVMPPMTSSNSVASGGGGTPPLPSKGTHSMLRRRPGRPDGRTRIAIMETRSIVVTGMSCDHCANAVRAEIGKLPGWPT